MPVALISIRTSPAFGPSRSTSTISSGFFASKATAARVFKSSSQAWLGRRDQNDNPRVAQLRLRRLGCGDREGMRPAMKLHNRLTELLHLSIPIVQAPMGGGIAGPTLAAAVSNAGGLGILPIWPMQLDQAAQQLT